MHAKTVIDLIGLLLGVAFMAKAVRGYVKGAFGPTATRKSARTRFWLSLTRFAVAGALLIGFAAFLLLHPSDDGARNAIAGVGYVAGGMAFAARGISGLLKGQLHAGQVYRDESPFQFWFVVATYSAVGAMWIWLGVARLP